MPVDLERPLVLAKCIFVLMHCDFAGFKPKMILMYFYLMTLFTPFIEIRHQTIINSF